MNIRGTRVSISGVRGGVRGYQYPGYEGINIRGTRVPISGVRGYEYSGYEGMNIRGTRVCIFGVLRIYDVGVFNTLTRTLTH